MDEFKDYYDILGLSKTATKEELKAAFRDVARRTHPDTVQGDEEKRLATEKFKDVNEAYMCLNDAKLRAEYDGIYDSRKAEELTEKLRSEQTSENKTTPHQESQAETKTSGFGAFFGSNQKFTNFRQRTMKEVMDEFDRNWQKGVRDFDEIMKSMGFSEILEPTQEGRY